MYFFGCVVLWLLVSSVTKQMNSLLWIGYCVILIQSKDWILSCFMHWEFVWWVKYLLIMGDIAILIVYSILISVL